MEEPEIPDFSTAHVLVVGDVMLDRYWSGMAERISPEAPVPIVKIGGLEERCGGAGNVAVNIARLGAKVTLIGAIGDDEQGRVLSALLERHGVTTHLCVAPQARTTVKLRVLSQHQQLMRIDFETTVLDDQLAEIKELYAREIDSHDVVIFSDYGKGVLVDITDLLKSAHEHGRLTLVDPWGDDFTRYAYASAITPNAKEFSVIAGTSRDEADLHSRAEKMIENLSLGCLLLTRGENGISLYQPDTHTVHIPSEAREVFDVTGAGDTVIAAFGASLACGLSMESAARLANRAAGLVVGRLGTASVSVGDLTEQRILSVAQLVDAVKSAQINGLKVVMTNGCFDILHAGHVAYLAQAARLGDRLVVAINTDESVARLKGEGRPVNPLSHRQSVLSALRAVDWVVAFDGTESKPLTPDTPIALIDEVRPDILVKGSDYDVSEIAGADHVLAYGGKVCTVPLVEGLSTTQIVDQIKEFSQ